ncbi:MAG TPA: hypothetical protein VJS19_10590 [Candidatus Dormibacteraeota bacterium]|nr:hypothetical protein [Candidatus Dormibacteraeota bacterium]
MARNPYVAIAVGIVMLVISFLVPGETRDLILRVAGALAIVLGVGMFVMGRR